jgi:beta-lactamase superfamily II metal-dependent hydrolase
MYDYSALMLRTFYRILFVVLLIGTLSVYREILAPPLLEVRVLDVGKGSAILVKSPSGKTLLIDTGPDASILRALGSALPMWQRRLDAVIITSPAKSAAGGLPEVTIRYRVHTLIRSATRDERFDLGGGAYVDVLWPPPTDTPLNTANGSLILRISYGTTSFLIQNTTPRISAWLSTLDAHLPPPTVSVSSSTPPGTYTSNGEAVVEN